VSTEIARRVTHDDLPSTQASQAITQALEGLRAIRTFIKAEFVEGVDFGTIPGCGDKPTLFLPGAQKAMMYFNARPKRVIERIDLGQGHVEFILTTKVISRATGQFLGEGVGCCSTMESKYRYRKAERLCPSCGKPAIINGKEEYGGGYLCFAKKGGCGAKFGKGNKQIESQKQGLVENTDLYDVHNTVLKIGKKRADVDAAMTLGCLSELFTQDIEDTFPMVEVREAARPEEPEPHHVNGEIVEPPPAPSPTGKGSGLGTKEHLEKTAKFNAWATKQCEAINAKWHAEWEARCDKALQDGHGVPSKIPDVINPWGFKGHLVKWAVESERLDPSIVPEDVKTRQNDALCALVFHRSSDDKAALIAEMGRYLQDQRLRKSEPIYRKHPELAPDGYFEEQAEAHEPQPDRGDAYEGPDDAAAVANGQTEVG
jgi:hypothetical protein